MKRRGDAIEAISPPEHECEGASIPAHRFNVHPEPSAQMDTIVRLRRGFALLSGNTA